MEDGNKGIGERIKQLRESFNMSQTDLAEKLGYKTYTTITKWENGNNLPRGTELKIMAEMFNVTSDYILGLNNEMRNFKQVNSVEINYLGAVAAGGFEDGYVALDKISVPNDILKEDKENYFVLRANGDSMNKVVSNDHYIVVLDFRKSSNTFYRTNDIVIVRNGADYTMKRIRKTDTMVHFEPDSYIDEFETQSFKIDDFNELMIIGKVVYSFRKFS